MANELAKIPLPTILELRNDETLVIREQENALNVLLNQEPNAKWIQKHPFIKIKNAEGQQIPLPYIPVETLEWLMTRIFIRWKREVLRVDLMANAVAVTLRLHYLNPVSGEWEWTDGVGAAAMQVNKDSAPTDFTQMKSNAVEIGLPKAKTEAFKDAAGDLGRLFGRDLTRKYAMSYSSLLEQFPGTLTPEEAAELDALLKQTDEKFQEGLLTDFGIESCIGLPKSKVRQFKARIVDRMNFVF